MKWVIGGLLAWLLASAAQNPFNDTDDPASVPWESVVVTNYRAACVDYEEPRNMGERVVPGLDELDQVGDSHTYSAATGPDTGARAFLVDCDSPPPEHLR